MTLLRGIAGGAGFRQGFHVHLPSNSTGGCQRKIKTCLHSDHSQINEKKKGVHRKHVILLRASVAQPSVNPTDLA